MVPSSIPCERLGSLLRPRGSERRTVLQPSLRTSRTSRRLTGRARAAGSSVPSGTDAESGGTGGGTHRIWAGLIREGFWEMIFGI